VDDENQEANHRFHRLHRLTKAGNLHLIEPTRRRQKCEPQKPINFSSFSDL